MMFFLLLVMVLGLIDVLFYYVGEMLGLGLAYFILLGGWFNMVIIGIFWLIYELFLTPAESKILRKCRIEKRIPVIAETDSGLLQFDYEVKSTPEGGILTKKNGPMFVPRSIFASDDEASELAQVHPVVAKRSFIAGVGMPVWFGYQGKGVLTNLRSLAELQHGKMDMEGNPTPSQLEQIGISKKVVKIFWPVALKVLKSHFSDSWNQAQTVAQETDAEMSGYKKGRKESRDQKMWIWFLIAGGFCIGMLGLVFYFLK